MTTFPHRKLGKANLTSGSWYSLLLMNKDQVRTFMCGHKIVGTKKNIQSSFFLLNMPALFYFSDKHSRIWYYVSLEKKSYPLCHYFFTHHCSLSSSSGLIFFILYDACARNIVCVNENCSMKNYCTWAQRNMKASTYFFRVTHTKKKSPEPKNVLRICNFAVSQ